MLTGPSIQERTPGVRTTFYLLRVGDRIAGRLRSSRVRLRLLASGAHVGRGLSVAHNVRIITSPGAKWQLGHHVALGTGVVLSAGERACLTIGNDVRITHYTVVGAEDSITIGDRAQIGEHCSIRDHDHDASATSMHAAAIVSSPVSIGEDSWIGRGAAVLKGSHIAPGAVVGANAVVRGEIPENAVAVGAPARVIRIRR